MATESIENSSNVYWFVGATFDTVDQIPRFLEQGIWENGYQDRHLDLVRSMRVGDRIAIKAAYTRLRDLPFDNRGNRVSVMAIKAIGTITENLNDGRFVRVNWQPVEPLREWYFYTSRVTIWRVIPGEWTTDGLIAFTFQNQQQDINRFSNAPYWRERFGTNQQEQNRFGWTGFYEEFATKLLDFRERRTELVQALQEISSRIDGLGLLSGDQFADGETGFVRDICPFTYMALFNRGLTTQNRITVAGELANVIGATSPVPNSFDGVPLVNNQRSWFFPYEINREADHIDSLWEVFAQAINYADSSDADSKLEFGVAFDAANGRPGVAWNLTFGLYWIRPWAFPTLDKPCRNYIATTLRLPIGLTGPRNRCSSSDYLQIKELLNSRFLEATYPVHSYPELSLQAWQHQEPIESLAGENIESEGTDEVSQMAIPFVPYSIDNIISDGSFLERAELDLLVERVRTKKNLILQGPPGTGKTWLAKRLAYALIGLKDDSKVRAVQFHPNLSYEDFVRGWRPTGDGKLSLADGVFMEAIKAASRDPESKFVVVIEEINRGNPAQIFGELLTLLEAGKRTPSEALELCYPDADGVRRPVHIPENLYVIGTMNIADRSLTLVDLALRRRFAFITLEPKLGSAWTTWVVNQSGVDNDLVADIEHRITALNNQIAEDGRLGKQFRIGHSYVTPPYPLEQGGTKYWFRQVVETEIGPLLEEYWFDSPEVALSAKNALLEGW